MDERRYDRQEALFGVEGQQRIHQKRVGIAGLGGLGSHVAQQLAFLGVLDYALVDPDIVSASSLNRVIGAAGDDVIDKMPKVLVAQRLIETIQPKALVREMVLPVEADAARRALREVDLVFGCLDDDLTRLQLTEICARSGVAYIDLASDTGGDDGAAWYGGRVLFSEGGKRCPSCMGLLDARAMARAVMTPEQRVEDDRLYGVSRSALDETGPAVVSVNGVIASLGVTEFMVWATGLREPWPLLIYRGDLGRVNLRTDPPAPDCYYCTAVWGVDKLRNAEER